MPALDHLHTYVRFKAKSGPGRSYKNKVFRCDHPNCTCFNEVELVIGKECSCSACGQPYVMNREQARRVRPTCLDCSNTQEARKHRAAASAMDRLFKGFERPQSQVEEIIENEPMPEL